jgi:hypothetical protein
MKSIQITRAALAVMCSLAGSGALRGQSPAQNPPQQNPPPSPTPGQPGNLTTQYPTAPQGPVPLSDEPHHRLVLQNSFTKVYNVTVPPLDATLLHQHDYPYLYVVLGPADLINAIQGKPELHQVLQDGDVHYTAGHFAHVARTDSGTAFHNITIELLHAQGTATNLCKDVIAGQPLDCPKQEVAAAKTNQEEKASGNLKTASNARTKKGSRSGKGHKQEPAAKPAAADDDTPYFETDEVRVEMRKVSAGRDFVETAPKTDALLLALTDANLDINLGGEHVQFLHGGDVLWLPARQNRRVVDFLGTRSNFLLVSFKDSSAPTLSQ